MNFFRIRGHFLLASPIDDDRFCRSVAQGRPGRIHRDVAPSDDRDAIPQGDIPAEVCFPQVFNAGDHTFEVLSGESERLALVGAYAHEEGPVSPVSQLRDGKVFTDLHARFELHAHIPHDLDFGFDYVLRQPVGRNADGQHASEHRQFFENRYLVAFYRQVIGAR